ncbi:MAG: hypothetical protein ACLPZM_06020 [Thermoplasmata archaeon]
MVLLFVVLLPVGRIAPSAGFSTGILGPGSLDEQISLPSPASTAPLTWTELLPEGLPPSNLSTSPVLVYDPLTQQTLDFAGSETSGLTSIWGFEDGVWTNVTPSGGLAHQDLTEFSTTFDVASGYVLLFGYIGDQDQTSAEAQTWTYSAGTWTQLSPNAEPRGTPMAGVTYDPVESSAVLLTTLFHTANSLTWSFQGGNWTQLDTSASPPALYGSTMAFDNSTLDQEVVLFADGIQPAGPVQGFWNQTWVFRGDQWVNVTAVSGPSPPAAEGAMTYDSSDQVLLLVDAGYFANITPARTWEFTDGQWSYLNTPSIVPFLGDGGGNFAYDAHDGYCLFVGNFISSYSGNFTTETWKFDRTSLGPLPSLALNVTPRELAVGGTVHIAASAAGGYGALAIQVTIDLPGQYQTEREPGLWNFTVTEGGLGLVFLGVADQSGRFVDLHAFLNVTSPASPSTDLPVYILGAGVVAVAAIVTVLIVVRRRRTRSPPSNDDRSEAIPPKASG